MRRLRERKMKRQGKREKPKARKRASARKDCFGVRKNNNSKMAPMDPQKRTRHQRVTVARSCREDSCVQGSIAIGLVIKGIFDDFKDLYIA
ncbi:hypothetical protein EVAR_96556_1 [Eumeta japonica]|uniref:Uncharacterized protein n=1 Tax=Eumeta variegata TaxID=151549 RepID=A0A4C1WCY4_EUMVA|nr:hypothetical protein EVAR_96556_1 [Eumeta japonica]